MVRLQSCKMWWRQGQWRGTYATENHSIDNVRVVLSSLSPPIQQIILHPICQHFPMLLSLEAIFMSVCIVKLSILIHVVGFLCLLVIYILILFDMVILFNMKTFKKHTNKCAILGTSLAGDIQQLLNSSGEC